MNGLDITVMGIIAVCALIGYYRGFLRMAYSVISWIFVLIFVSWATPYFADFLEKNTGIKSFVQEKCADYMESMAKERIEDETARAGGGEDGDGLNGFVGSAAGIIGGALAESGLYEDASSQIAHWIIQGIAFLLVTAIVGTITFRISRMLNLVARIPAIRGPDKLLGSAAGGLKGLVIVWILMFLVNFGIGSEFGRQCLVWIDESEFLKYLYKNNILLDIVLQFLGT